MSKTEENVDWKKLDEELNAYIKSEQFSTLQKKYKYLGYSECEKNTIILAENQFKKQNKEAFFIPQFWWGDVTKKTTENDKMKAVILGKNPSLKISDDCNDLNDLECQREALGKNVSLQNREESINLLLNCDESYFYDWWIKKAFKGIDIHSMKGIAIYNLFGFYSREFPNDLDVEYSHISNPVFKKHISNQIKNCEYIFLMWIASWPKWKQLLGEDTFKDKTIFVVNAKGNCNKIIWNSVPMKSKELDNFYDEIIIKERKEIMKATLEKDNLSEITAIDHKMH